MSRDLELAFAVAVELHAEADVAGLAGAGELAEKRRQDGAGQRLLQTHTHTGQRLKVMVDTHTQTPTQTAHP